MTVESHDAADVVPREGPSTAVVEHLCNAVRQAMRDPETMEVVGVICDNNGLTVEDFMHAPHDITTMELFLLSLPQIPQLRLFPYLKVVKIIHVGLESMESLTYLHYVEELWLNENNICMIEGLQQMQRLRVLFLHGNLIKTMDGIPHLPQLEKLWLCGNRLQHITGLGSLPKLKSISLASNQIATLEDAFSPSMTSIEELNLADNRIFFFAQLKHLCVLKSLSSLWLGDPMYGVSPICHLSNYVTFSLQHLPQLEQLDGIGITAEQRSLAISVYAKKIIYYSMRRAILSRNMVILQILVQQEAEKRRNIVRDALRRLDLQLSEFGEYECDSSSTGSDLKKENIKPISMLRRARETREVELEGIERHLLDAVKRTEFETCSLNMRLLAELNSCGSIRLEEGLDTDNWCVNAKELLSCRFDAKMYGKFGFTGVRASRVFRITCQSLRERFDNRVCELDIDLANTRNRRALVLLFSAVPSRPKDQRSFIHEIIANGFTGLYKEDDGVPLTNSLYYADQERLLSLSNYNGCVHGISPPSELLSGQLVVSRLFLGKCVAEMGGGREFSSSAASNTSATGATNTTGMSFTAGGNTEPIFMKNDRRKVARRHYGDEVFSIYRSAPHDASVKVWHVFDKYLVLPEYVIDFVYTTKERLLISPSLSIFDDPATLQMLLEKAIPESAKECFSDARNGGYPMLAFLHWLNSSPFHDFANGETEDVVREVKKMQLPKVSSSKKENMHGTEAIKEHTEQKEVAEDDIGVYYNKSNQRMKTIPKSLITAKGTSLRILLLQNNAITSVPWASLASAAPLLERLDLGNNALERMELAGAQFPLLGTLCICFNKLANLEDLLQLHEGAPVLNDLQMNNNPWLNTKGAELFCLAVVPQLQYLNGIAISRHAYFSLLRRRTLQLNQSRLQYIIAEEQKRRGETIIPTLLNSSSTGVEESGGVTDVLRAFTFEQVFDTLAGQTEADCNAQLSAKKDALAPSLKGARVFCFHQSLTRDLAWVQWLPQLRHLSLSSHVIEDLSPLVELRHLKTLNVSDNLVKTVKMLGGMKLVSLDLSQNMLTDTEGIERLGELRFLSIRHNFISDVSALQNCTFLEELYLAENKIREVCDLYPLHHLPKLVSLDVVGNPCAGVGDTESRAGFRNYIIHNLPRLKVLDGVPIGDADQQRAEEFFLGRVNAELLADRVGVATQWCNVHEMDLSHCGLREMTMMEPFVHLKVLQLHHNNLESIDGLLPLRNLVALNVSHNRLCQCRVGKVLQHLETLRSLSLESNHITDTATLGLSLPRLQFLNLKGNEIVSLDRGLHGLTDLRELLLDNNKLRALGTDCLAKNLQLTEISAEENFIRSTEGIRPLERLEVLLLGSNRLGDLTLLLSDLQSARSLVKLTFTGNAVARKAGYRSQVVSVLSSLTMLDNKEVTDVEREKAELLKAAEFTTPHNVVLDPSFPLEAVGGARLNVAAGVLRPLPPQQPHRFPFPVNQRLQLPPYKNTRTSSQMKDNTKKGLVPRLQGGR